MLFLPLFQWTLELVGGLDEGSRSERQSWKHSEGNPWWTKIGFKQIDDQQSTVYKDGVVLRYTGVEYGRVMLLYKCSIMVVVIKRDSKSLGSITEYCVSTWSFSSHV